jgi:hypothetical protein
MLTQRRLRAVNTPRRELLGNSSELGIVPEEWWNRDPVPENMPKEWWDKEFPSDLSRLIDTLIKRRSKIRDLITDFRNSTRNPFPNWAGN